MIGLDFDAYELQQQILRTAEQLKIAPAKIVKTEALLLLRQVVKFTSPNSRAQGRKAVKRDINRAITPLDASKFENPRIAKMIRKRDYVGLNAMMKNVPGWKKWEVVPFTEELHTKARDKRGRVQRFKRKFTVEKTAWNKYVRKTQAEVGSAKAAWSVGIKEVGGASLPAWIAEHNAEGRYATTVAVLEGDSPKLIVRTSAKGVKGDPDFQRQLKRAIETRIKSMVNKTKRMLRDPLKYANLFAQYQ